MDSEQPRFSATSSLLPHPLAVDYIEVFGVCFMPLSAGTPTATSASHWSGSPRRITPVLRVPLHPSEVDVARENAREFADDVINYSYHVVCGKLVKKAYVNVLLCLMAVLGQVGQHAALPQFADSLVAAGITPYFLCVFVSLAGTCLFLVVLLPLHFFTNTITGADRRYPHGFLALVGVLNAASGLCVAYTAPTSRTSPIVQCVFGTATTPLSCAVYATVRRDAGTPWRMLFAVLVGVGLVLTYLPVALGLQDPRNGDLTLPGRVLWPGLCLLAYVPTAFLNVLELLAAYSAVHVSATPSPFHSTFAAHSSVELNVMYLLFWTSLYSTLCVMCSFWTDSLPLVGTSSDPIATLEKLHNGLLCFVETSQNCRDVVRWGGFFVVCCFMSYVGFGLLLRHASVITTCITITVSTPLSVALWLLFRPRPLQPYMASGPTTWLTIAAMLPLVVGVLGYRLHDVKQYLREQLTSSVLDRVIAGA